MRFTTKSCNFSNSSINLSSFFRENKVKHAMKMGVFDSPGVISIDKNFWGVFFGNKTIVLEPQCIRKPLYAKDAYKTTFVHFLKVFF